MDTPSIFLDRRSREPLYRQLRRAVAHLIETGYYGEVRLPPSRAMAKDLGVSRKTVNLAYQELIVEGYLVSNPRSGILVNADLQRRTAQAIAPAAPVTVPWPSRFKNCMSAEAIQRVEGWNEFPYPFITGQFDVHMFPRRALLSSFRRAMQQNNLVSSLQDWFQEDDPYFVDVICRRILPSRGIEAAPGEVLVTLGSQQGLHLLYDTLIDRTSTVALEDPSYIDGRMVVQRTGASIKYLRVDECGVIPPETLAGVDMIYVTPGHQHPTNVTLSIARRYEILEMARQSGTIIIEDDYDCEFQYMGSPSPALRALDQSALVVYLGSFSKFLAPGLRLGYMVADRVLVEEIRQRRRFMYRHPPGPMQRSVAHMIEAGDYGSHLRRYRRLLHKRWRAMNMAAERHLPWTITPSRGGLCLWTEGPEELDINSILDAARERGVLLYRTDLHFSPERRRSNSLRLGFGAIESSAIERGVEILGTLIKDHLAQLRPARSDAPTTVR